MRDIFRHFVVHGNPTENKQRLSYAAWIADSIPLDHFEPDEQLFIQFIKFCSRLDVALKLKYLNTWINTDLRRTLQSTNIHVQGCEGLHFDESIAFETAVQTSAQVLRDLFEQLMEMESEVDDFKVDVSEFFNDQKRKLLQEALSKTFDTLSNTSDAEVAADVADSEIAMIKSVYSQENLDELFEQTGSVGRTEIVSRCGLPPIDKDSSCLARKQLFSIDAQPGTGKTRFAIGCYCYESLVTYKKNVLFISLEQPVEELDAMLIAKHVFKMFGKQIDSKLIHRDAVPDNLKAEVEAARYDLFESGNYGKWYRVVTELDVETFIDRIKNIDRLHGPFDLICLDHAGLMESRPINPRDRAIKDKYIIIGDTYKYLKRYVRKNNKAGIILLQLNTLGIDAGEADKTITPNMAEGGTQAYKHTDYNIAITMTATMKAQQRRRFSLPKVRDSAGFAPFIAETRLAFCHVYLNSAVSV